MKLDMENGATYQSGHAVQQRMSTYKCNKEIPLSYLLFATAFVVHLS